MKLQGSTIKITAAGIVLLSLLFFAWGVLDVGLVLLSGGVVGLLLWLQTVVLGDDETAAEVVPPVPAPAPAERNELLTLLESDIRHSLQVLMDASHHLIVDDLSLAQRRQVSQIRETTESLEEMIARSLDYVAIDAGHLRLNEMDFSLRECVADALASRRGVAGTPVWKITPLIQTRVPDALSGDAQRLQNIIITLLERVDVENPGFEFRVALLEREDDTALIRFSLSGTGVNGLADVWRQFCSDLESVTDHTSSSSLPLALTKQMVELMGGEVAVDMARLGSTVSFTTRFRVIREAHVATSTQRTTSLGLIPELPVLVVHPDDDARTQLVELLEKWETEPMCVTAEDDMWQHVEKARQAGSPFGLMIVAPQVGSKAGLAVCAEMHRNQLYSAIPRILLVDDAEVAKSGPAALDHNAIPLLRPVNSVRLARTIISAVLGKGRYKQMRMGIGAAEMYVRSLIPPPMSEPVAVDWRYVPAADLAGDALGYHWIDDEHIAFYVIDVCGHGMDAALLSVSVLNVLKSMALPETDFRQPDEVLTQLNRKFPMEAQGDRCFTGWYGVFNRSSHELKWAGAGHPPGLLFSQAGDESAAQLASRGPMVGMIADSTFESASCQVSPGDRLVLYTDGVFEFQAADGKFGTLDDFLAYVESRQQSDTLLDDLWNRARQATGSSTLEDDFTVVDVIF